PCPSTWTRKLPDCSSGSSTCSSPLSPSSRRTTSGWRLKVHIKLSITATKQGKFIEAVIGTESRDSVLFLSTLLVPGANGSILLVTAYHHLSDERSFIMAEIRWEQDFKAAVEAAGKAHKPIYLDF